MVEKKQKIKSFLAKAGKATANFFVKNRYFFGKIGVALLTLALSAILLFFLLRMIPGDIVELYALKLQNQQGITYDRAYELASQLLNYNPQRKRLCRLRKVRGRIVPRSTRRVLPRNGRFGK